MPLTMRKTSLNIGINFSSRAFPSSRMYVRVSPTNAEETINHRMKFSFRCLGLFSLSINALDLPINYFRMFPVWEVPKEKKIIQTRCQKLRMDKCVKVKFKNKIENIYSNIKEEFYI